MSTETYAYPFDPSGLLASNLIDGERQVITPPNWSDFYIVIPEAAPFFREGLRLIHHPSGNILTEGVDYYCTHRFHDASLAIAKPVFGSITILNRSLEGVLELKYQTLGGEWTLSEQQISDILAEELANPRTTTWEQVVDLPREFPVIDHPWDLVDMVGASSVVEKLDEIAQAIRDNAEGATQSHINDTDNPHQVTKTQVGLGSVANYPPASEAEALDGTLANRYMTPVVTRAVVMSLVGDEFNLHKNNNNNPHGVNKAHIGLSNVGNYAMATTGDATTGTAANLYMSPVTTAAVVDAKLAAVATPHINNLNNPHQVTAAQLGLGNVANYGPATLEMATTGSDNAHVMTPLRVRQAIDALFGATLIDHINNRGNPHQVTKAHVGLDKVPNLPLATVTAAQAGSDDSGLMTPRLTSELIAAMGGVGGGTIDAVHRANLNNPHQVTAAQVGAYTQLQVDALLTDKMGRSDTAANSERLEGQTSAEIIRQATVRYNWPAVTPREVDDGAGGTVTVNEGTTWTALGAYVPPGVVDPTAPIADMVFYVTGGDRVGANSTPLYLVKLNLFNTLRMEVEQLAGEVDGTQFGYVRDLATQGVTVYVKSVPSRCPLSVVVISDPSGGMGLTQAPLDSEPTNIVYAQSFLYRSGSASSEANPGEIAFGNNPLLDDEAEFGAMLEFANIAELPEDIIASQITESSLDDDIHDFIPSSAYGTVQRVAVKEDLLGWGMSATRQGFQHDNVGSSLCMLRSPNAYSRYSFEVEMSSSDDNDMALGVCIAFVRKNGKDHGLYALRTPGGLVLSSEAGNEPGGDIYKLFSVGYNLFQEEALDLGSTNAGLVWGDGVDDSDRESSGPFSNAGLDHGWATNAVCRIKVIRNGNSIIVQTSQFGSSNVTSGATVVIDLNSIPELAVFKGPTSWGVVKYKQAASIFTIISRPDQYQPYIVSSRDSNGNDTSTMNRYIGDGWISEPMGLEFSFTRPGRLYYSNLTHRLYYARRDGSLKPLHIAAYSPDDVTVLTP